MGQRTTEEGGGGEEALTQSLEKGRLPYIISHFSFVIGLPLFSVIPRLKKAVHEVHEKFVDRFLVFIKLFTNHRTVSNAMTNDK